MDAIFCITLSMIILRAWWKHKPIFIDKPRDNTVTNTVKYDPIADKALREKKAQEAQRAKDEAELRKQGLTDELIATILPIINDK